MIRVFANWNKESSCTRHLMVTSKKIDKDLIKPTSVHKHFTRHTSNKFHLPRVNTCYGHKMLSFAGAKLWSKLDPDLISFGWLSFEKHLKRKLLEKYDN